jgi:DNA-binding MarR family transcriptional regulator
MSKTPTLDAPNQRRGATDGPDALGYLLRQASAAHRLRMDRALADIEVTPPQFLVLTLLARHPGASNAELARIAALSTPTVSVIVANLLRIRALARRPHAIHGRVQHLDLTVVGRNLLAACLERVTAVEIELAKGLSKPEVGAIRDWLVRIARTAAQEAKPGRTPSAVQPT